MNILEKAKELGQAIAESEQNKRLIAAEIAQENDVEAQNLLMQYNVRRKEITDRLKENQPGPEELETYRAELQKEFDLLMENKNIKEYVEAKKELDHLVQSVNSVISYYITGEEQSGGCSSSGCSGCSGCH